MGLVQEGHSAGFTGGHQYRTTSPLGGNLGSANFRPPPPLGQDGDNNLPVMTASPQQVLGNEKQRRGKRQNFEVRLREKTKVRSKLGE